MLVSYSQTDGLITAAKDTFSGEKPCALCCKITAAKKSQQENGKRNDPQSPLSSSKLLQEMIATTIITAASPPRPRDSPSIRFPGFLLPVACGSAAPPTPPPRAVA
jgi:hypothetical protein